MELKAGDWFTKKDANPEVLLYEVEDPDFDPSFQKTYPKPSFQKTYLKAKIIRSSKREIGCSIVIDYTRFNDEYHRLSVRQEVTLMVRLAEKAHYELKEATARLERCVLRLANLVTTE